MRANRGMLTLEFDRLFGAGDGSERSAKNVRASVLGDIALGLLEFDNLRLASKAIEEIDAGVVRKTKSGCDFGKAGEFGFALGVGFFVDGCGFGNGGSGMFFLQFLGRRPVDESGGEFLPLVAFGAHVADAVAVNFIFGYDLIGAIFQNKALAVSLILAMGRDDKRGGEQNYRFGIMAKEG